MTKIMPRRLHDAIHAENKLALQLPLEVYTQLCIRKLHPSLGVMDWSFNPDKNEYTASDEVIHRIDMLLGPHAYAMFRAWAINQLEATNEAQEGTGNHLK